MPLLFSIGSETFSVAILSQNQKPLDILQRNIIMYFSSNFLFKTSILNVLSVVTEGSKKQETGIMISSKERFFT